MGIIGISKYDFVRQNAFKDKVWGIVFNSGLQCILLYRISHWFIIKRHPIFKLMSDVIFRINVVLNHSEIPPTVIIGKGCIVLHSIGIVIGSTAEIGDDVIISPGVIIAARFHGLDGKRHATIENNVFIGAGSIILGDVKVGENAVIAAGSVVNMNVHKDAIVAGVPAVQIGENANGKS
jgi:serine O-acetyltransferase